MPLACDIETDGLDATVITALCWIDIETGEEHDCGPDIEAGLRTLMDYDGELVFHNGVDFDLPVIQELYDWFEPKHPIVDTLVLSRLAYQDMLSHDLPLWDNAKMWAVDRRARLGSHGLATWGVRLRIGKHVYVDDNDEWPDHYTKRLGQYCLQDCRVTRRLYGHLMQQPLSPMAVELEHAFSAAMRAVRVRGFAFDVEAAEDLWQTLSDKVAMIEHQLVGTFGGWYAPVGEPVVPKRSVKYKDKPHVTEGVPYQKVSYTVFNPQSRAHIEKVLCDRGWEPDVRTPTGQAKVDEDTLRKIADRWPEAGLLADHFMLQKRRALLLSWREAQQYGRVNAQIIPNATITGRTSSRAPNFQAVPRVGSPYGKECRALFTASPGRVLLASDLDRAELTMLAHYLDDGGAYGELLQTADIHQVNADRMGITRNQMKGVQFGFIYGAGDTKLGEMTGLPGAEVRERLYAAIPGLSDLIAKVQKDSEQGFIVSIDGRHIPVAKKHTALNYLIQSATSSVAKRWAVNCWQAMLDMRCDLCLYVHDELQFDCDPALTERAGEIVRESLRESNDYFKVTTPLTCDLQQGANWSESH